MSDRVVLVTGAASGIGAAVAAAFAAEGDEVVGVDIAAASGSGVTRCDVTSASDIAAVVGGLERLDVLCNVAGIPQFGPVSELTDDEWDRVLAVDLTAPFRLVRAALPLLRASKGCVVNLASVAGIQGQAYTAAYSAAKGGLVMLTKALAVELSVDGVRVNCVCPGAVDTPLVLDVAPKITSDLDPGLVAKQFGLLPGMATAEQVASAVVWLASPAAALVTGAALPIDGGRSA